MRFVGRIELSKELSFTQAEQLREFFSRSHTGTYFRACLKISEDGRALCWDGSDEKVKLEYVFADVIKLFLKGWGIFCTGVVCVIGPKSEKSYEIVVLKSIVKVVQDKNIVTIN